MPLTHCRHCRRYIQIPDVTTDEAGACPYCRSDLWLYKCFSCMKVTAFLDTLPRPARCPSCQTMVRSGKPLPPPPVRKRIAIEIGHSPGTGNIANARHIRNALRQKYMVHIHVAGNQDAVNKIFGQDYVAADPRGKYDLVILPGIERIMGGRLITRLTNPPRLKMSLPPPFCSHLFDDPFYRRGTAKPIKLSLETSLPFLPLSQSWRQIQKAQDFKGMKAIHFPGVHASDVFFIVTYLGLGSTTTDAFNECEERIVILNFGTCQLLAPGARNVVSVRCERLSMIDFEQCLVQCTTLYPAMTDGANTVGTLQALELPYYDLSSSRAKMGDIAFLNDGSCDMGLFRTLTSRQKNIEAFREVERRTQTYYNAMRLARQQGRGAEILRLVESVLK